LNVIQCHCRVIWGMNSNLADGDGVEPPPHVDPRKVAEAEILLRRRDWEALKRLEVPCLYMLCYKRRLPRPERRAGPLVGALHSWVCIFFIYSPNHHPTCFLPCTVH
jgi:hypothetical protein